MDYQKLDDVTLIRLVGQEKADALSELYDRYVRLVFSLALNAVGDRSIAEEITQEVFTQVWRHAASYQADKAKVVTWLTSITRYRAIDIWRRRSIRPEGHPGSWDEASQLPNQVALEQEVERSLVQERVRQAIAQLPDEQKQALALAYFRGFTHQEIAQTLEAPLGTVKTRIRLAMQKLRTMLQEDPSLDGLI